MPFLFGSSLAAAPSDGYSEEEDLLYCNLCILGLDRGAGHKLNGCEISRTMFQRVNPKSVECVLYALYGAYKGKATAKKVFRGIFPVGNDKRIAKEFYAKINDFFKDLKEGSQVEGLTNSTLNTLRTQSGHRCDFIAMVDSRLAYSGLQTPESGL